MRTLRYPLAVLGAILTPFIGSIYFGLLCLFNLDRKKEAVSDDIVDETGLLCRRARFVINAGAVTFGEHIFTRYAFPSSRLIRHELQHVRQYDERGFILFLVQYGWELGLHGYRANHLELEARDVAGV